MPAVRIFGVFFYYLFENIIVRIQRVPFYKDQFSVQFFKGLIMFRGRRKNALTAVLNTPAVFENIVVVNFLINLNIIFRMVAAVNIGNPQQQVNTLLKGRNIISIAKFFRRLVQIIETPRALIAGFCVLSEKGSFGFDNCPFPKCPIPK